MNFFEAVKLAFASISVNKLRSFLTMLGIIIGISSVITITTIGNSLKRTIETTMNELGGSNLIYGYVEAIFPEDEAEYETWVYPDMTDEDFITDEDIENYKKAFSDEVQNVIINNFLAEGAIYKEDSYSATVNIIGSSANSLAASKLEIVRGRDISDADYDQLRKSAIVSDLFVQYALSGNEDPIGKEVSFSTAEGDTYTFIIAGVYHYDKRILDDGTNMNKSEKDTITPVFIAATTANSLNEFPMPGYDSIQIMSKPSANPTELAEKTNDYFNNVVYGQNEEFHLQCFDLASELAIINKVLDILTIAISIIAAISLVVGGVGVMNIMLVSIMERTKEIGIRKALGAKNSNIRMQFLTEAVIICLIGGIIGILIGIANGFLIGFLVKTIGGSLAADYMSYLTITVRPSIIAIIIAVGFSMLTGIVFGSYPASRAAKLSPIDALRYE